MLRIAICDDNLLFLTQLESLLKIWQSSNNHSVFKSFTDGDSLIQTHTKEPFDIIFLDVLMPLLNGIETAAELRSFDKTVKIVFLTSSPEFAVESYKVKANNYLLKPIQKEAFFQCLNELVQDIDSNMRCLTIKGCHATHRVFLDTIEYIESQNKKISFSLSDGYTFDSMEPLYIYENQLLLSDGFLRCHRSYIVNIYHIQKYTSKEITMRSGMRIPISRNCQKDFEKIYFSVIFGKAEDSYV